MMFCGVTSRWMTSRRAPSTSRRPWACSSAALTPNATVTTALTDSGWPLRIAALMMSSRLCPLMNSIDR